MVSEAHCMSFPYRTVIIELCQGKDSFSFYGTFNTFLFRFFRGGNES